jgi:hypothetical protein
MPSFAKTAQGFRLSFIGVPGRNYLLKRPTDFVSWTNLATLPAPIGSSMLYEDANPPPGSAFYRAVME